MNSSKTLEDIKEVSDSYCLPRPRSMSYPRAQGVLVMSAYGGLRATFLGLKFHLKAIFGGLRFAI